ncbi:proteasome subunit alpha type-5 [Tanacetum coccineum]
MERGFLSQKESGGGRGVKEKDKVVAANDVVSLRVIDEPVAKEKQRGNGIDVVVPVESIRAISERNTWGKYGLLKSMLNSSTGLFSFQFSSMDGLNAMLKNGSWFIRNHPLILKKWNPDVNLLKEDVSNVSVWVKLHSVPITAFVEDGLSVIATKLGTPLMLDSYTSDMCLQSWGRSSYARSMIDLRVDVELKDSIVEYPKNPGLGVVKNLKKPSQASKCVLVGPKVGFKPTKEYRPVSKKSTANSSGNKKKAMEPTKEVSNSNSFDVFNLVDNDEELCTNGGTSNLASNWANSSGSSFWTVETSSTSTTPIVEKIGKIEKLIIDGKVTLLDDNGKPLKNVDYLGDHDSENEVESVDNDMNDDYDEDPYNDDMYEGQDLPDKLQEICDNLDIIVRGCRKK